MRFATARARMLTLILMLSGLILISGIACAIDQPGTQRARVLGVDASNHTLTLILVGEARKLFVPVADAQKWLGRTPEPGDMVQVVLGVDDTVQDLSTTAGVPGLGGAIAALATGAAIVFGATMIASRALPLKFLIGTDNRYSNSKCQIALWFGTVATAYLAMMFLRVWAGGFNYIGGVAYPTNALLLSGLSALTFGGAKLITSQKVYNQRMSRSMATVAPEGAPANPQNGDKKPTVKPNLLTDLLQNDYSEVDIGDFQMILVTLIAVIVYLATCLNNLTSIPLQAHVMLPDVDTSLLAGFGLGQGAYLVKKAGSPLGEG